jgi:ribose/xylose/arabinose/galactoside ABC-type transport system permease subunit
MTTSEEQKKVAKKSVFSRYENSTVLTIFVAFFAVVILMQVGKTGGSAFPTFISPVNLLNIIQQIAVPGMVAVGMTMVMISGGIDLSVGMLASMVAIVTALGLSKWHLGVFPSILLGITVSVVADTILGYIISRTKVEPFIITLGGMITFQGIALLLCNSREVMMHGELNFFKANLIEGAKDPVTGLNLIIPPYVLIFFLVVILGWLLMNYTKYGRRIYAVGSNESAAFLAGVNTRNIKLSTYAINGFLVGVGAIMMLARINVGIITLGQSLEIDTIAMAVIGGTALSGGKGNIWGTFFGVLLLGSIGNAMNMLRLPPEVQYIAKGVIIILAVSLSYVYGNLSSSIMRMSRSAISRRNR